MGNPVAPRSKRAKISRVYVLVHGNLINDANGSSIPNFVDFLFSGECCLKKNQNAPRPSERPPVRGEKMSNDISTDLRGYTFLYSGTLSMTLTVVRFPTLTFFLFFGECCLKKNQNAPRPSERSPVRGEKCQMILVQLYNIFRLLLGVPDYSIVTSGEPYGGK